MPFLTAVSKLTVFRPLWPQNSPNFLSSLSLTSYIWVPLLATLHPELCQTFSLHLYFCSNFIQISKVTCIFSEYSQQQHREYSPYEEVKTLLYFASWTHHHFIYIYTHLFISLKERNIHEIKTYFIKIFLQLHVSSTGIGLNIYKCAINMWEVVT